MSLSYLLARVRPLAEASFARMDTTPATLNPACTLFFSLCDGQERATVLHVSANDFQQAWQAGVVRCNRVAPRRKRPFRWLRLDWVTSVEATTWSALNQRLRQTRRTYFRHGLAFDSQLKTAFLEQELNANAMLYGDSTVDHAELHQKNFTTYAAIRHGSRLALDFSPETAVYTFSTAGVFCDTGGEPHHLIDAGLSAGRRECGLLTSDPVLRLIDSGAEFLSRQVQKSGRFIYGYFPVFDRKIDTYNGLRHASSLYAMLESWEVTRSPTLQAATKRAMHYLTHTLIRHYTLPDGSPVAFLVDTDDEIKLGANAVALLALVKYNELTGDNGHQPLMESLALGIAHLQDPVTGQFRHVLHAADLSVKEAFRIIYYDGEAAFGLMRLYGLTREPRWLALVERAFDHFLAANHWQAHDHWLGYCVNELTRHKPEERYFRFGIRNIADHLDFILERETTYPTLLELTMAAEQMLSRLSELPAMEHLLRELDLDKFHRALEYRAHYLLNGFFWPEVAMYFKNPARIVGSFFIRHHAFRVRIDDIEHYLSGYVAYWHHLQKKGPAKEPTPSPPVARPGIRSSVCLLRRFDPEQLFRLFVDGRFHKKYDGWVGYEAGERGSVQALLNGFAHMLDHFDLTGGLEATYLLDLHKICMMGVQTRNLKSSPGDLRHLNAGMPFLAKTTTLENLREILELRHGDGTPVFNNSAYAKPAEALNADELHQAILRLGKLNYRNWYPNLSEQEQRALRKEAGLQSYYQVKHLVQMQFARRVDTIVDRFNRSMRTAHDDESRLRAIALLVRELELLHPFPDGNCRTFACVLLTQLLLNYGFPPALLENPNLDGECSLEQWIGVIKQGMACFETLLENPNARVYNYSIQDASAENRRRFAAMAEPLVDKIRAHNTLFLTPQRLQAYTGGHWLDAPPPPDLRFTGVGTYNTYGRGNLYFALEIGVWIRDGKNVREALATILAREQRALVLDNAEFARGWRVPVLLVTDAFAAFKTVAIQVRRELDPLTLLITGTEGKTGAKVQLHHLLDRQTCAHAVLNSANTEIPVLRSLAGLGMEHRVEINEVSVGADEAYRVERAVMVNPDLCLFTNIGPNHMDLHKTMENLLEAKSSVVAGLRDGGSCLVNSANPHCDGLTAAIRRRKPRATIITYGTRP
ncbi:MAG: Fic family protein, partial [Magnetococcales bacterium]|nr:Fic family protein [Magnetococcales bacterium]